MGNLNPKYIGPFEIVDTVDQVAYCLTLPLNMAFVHNVFHVSMLRKYVADPSHILRHEVLEIDPRATFEAKIM